MRCLTITYNAIAAVIYYNPQSILLHFTINKRCFQLRDFSFELPQLAKGQRYILVVTYIGTCDLPNIYVLSPQGYGHTYQANHSRLCYLHTTELSNLKVLVTALPATGALKYILTLLNCLIEAYGKM